MRQANPAGALAPGRQIFFQFVLILRWTASGLHPSSYPPPIDIGPHLYPSLLANTSYFMPFETTSVVASAASAGQDTEPQPRPEYPRPQLCRPDWLNLNGLWEFAFDDSDIGLRDQWYTGRVGFDRRIRVPFTFEAGQSGIGDGSFHERVWYRREIQIPSEWAGRRILLHFGAVDYRSTAWVNGSVVAAHEGGHTPFTCDITAALRGGKCVLVVRAGGSPYRWLYSTRQTVLEGAGRRHLLRPHHRNLADRLVRAGSRKLYRQCKITPVLQGTVKFEFKIALPKPDQFVKVIIRDNEQFLASGISIANGPLASVSLFVDDPKLWSPDSPHLYQGRLGPAQPEGAH